MAIEVLYRCLNKSWLKPAQYYGYGDVVVWRIGDRRPKYCKRRVGGSKLDLHASWSHTAPGSPPPQAVTATLWKLGVAWVSSSGLGKESAAAEATDAYPPSRPLSFFQASYASVSCFREAKCGMPAHHPALQMQRISIHPILPRGRRPATGRVTLSRRWWRSKFCVGIVG